MLRIDERWLDVPTERSDFRPIVDAIRSAEWVPAMATSREVFFGLAGAPPKYDQFVDPRMAPSASREAATSSVEVFFRDGAIFILQFLHGSAAWTSRPSLDPRSHGILVLRVATERVGEAEVEVTEFCDLVRSGVSAALDGRRVRHWSKDWVTASASTSRLDELSARLGEEEVPLSLKTAELGADLVAAAEVLSDRRTRELLIEIAQARFAREEDVLSKRGKAREDVAGSLEAMKDRALIVTEHVLQCRKTSAPLVRLSDPAQLQESATGQLRCAHCGKPFVEESLSEGYSLSELGKSLSRGSHWMTVWITEKLVSLGVVLASIAWNLEESSEEVDLLFEHLGRLWIVELKDRDFGAGDAHPFNYRRVRYRASEAVVVSAGRISSDAKKVFNELEKGSGRPRRSGSSMILIEGLEQVEPTLSASFERAALERVRARLSGPSATTGFDLAEIAAQRTSS